MSTKLQVIYWRLIIGVPLLIWRFVHVDTLVVHLTISASSSNVTAKGDYIPLGQHAGTEFRVKEEA